MNGVEKMENMAVSFVICHLSVDESRGKYEANHFASVVLRAIAAMLKYGFDSWLAIPANTPSTPSAVSQKSKSLSLMLPFACGACPNIAASSALVGLHCGATRRSSAPGNTIGRPPLPRIQVPLCSVWDRNTTTQSAPVVLSHPARGHAPPEVVVTT